MRLYIINRDVKQLPIWLGWEIFFFFWLQNFIFWAQGFFPDLFNTYLVKPDQLEPDRSHQGLDQWENLTLLSNSENPEGALLEPARSHQIKSIIEEAFRIYWVTQFILKNIQGQFSPLFLGGKTTPNCTKPIMWLRHIYKRYIFKKSEQNRLILSTAGSETFYRRLDRVATAN